MANNVKLCTNTLLLRTSVLIVFLFVFTFTVAQDKSTTTSLKTVIKAVSKQFKVQFAYDDQMARETYVPAQANFTHLEEALAFIKANSNFDYKMIDDMLVLIPKDPSEIVVGKLKGVVVDKTTKEPLPFAVLKTNSKKNAVSDMDGFFVLEGLSVATTQLSIHYVGYKVSEMPTRELIEEDTFLTITLVPDLNTLQEVVIEDKHQAFYHFPEEAGKLSYSVLQGHVSNGLGTMDLNQGLRNLPGVNSAAESGGLEVRGEEPQSNRVIMEDIPVYNPNHMFGVFGAFHSSFVNSVEIFKGGYPAQYGGRTASVLKYTNHYNDMYTNTKGTVNLNSITSEAWLNIPLNKKNISFQMAGRVSNSVFTNGLGPSAFQELLSSFNTKENKIPKDEIEAVPDSVVYATDNTVRYWFYDFHLKGGIQLTAKDQINVNYYQSEDSIVYESEIKTDNDIYYLKEDRPWKNYGGAVTWNRQHSEKLSLHTALSGSWYKSTYGLREEQKDIKKDVVELELDGERELTYVAEGRMRVDALYAVSKEKELSFGVQGSYYSLGHDKIRFDETGKSWRTANKYQAVTQLELYSSYTLPIGSKGKTILGVRVGGDNVGFVWVDPRVSMYYKPSEVITFKGSGGIFHQPLHNTYSITGQDYGKGRYYHYSDPEKVPVKIGYHVILGTTLSHRHWSLDIEGYGKYNKDVYFVLPTPPNIDTPIDEWEYSGDERIYGGDISLNYTRKRYATSMGYSLKWVEYKIPNIYAGEWFAGTLDQRHEWKWTHTYNLNRWTFTTGAFYGSSKPFSNPNQEGNNRSGFNFFNNDRLPDYRRLDVSASYHWSFHHWSIESGVSIFNVFNHKNVRERRIVQLNATDPNTPKEEPKMAFTPEESRLLNHNNDNPPSNNNPVANPSPMYNERNIYGLGFHPNIFLNLTF